MTLSKSEIAARIPHSGAMCLLNSMLSWSTDEIICLITNHGDSCHPLRSQSGLLASCAIEYAAQAMALHRCLCVSPGAAPVPGFLASARAVQTFGRHLHQIEGPMTLTVRCLAAASEQAIYQFQLHDGLAKLWVQGRATVVLNTPLPAASALGR